MFFVVEHIQLCYEVVFFGSLQLGEFYTVADILALGPDAPRCNDRLFRALVDGVARVRVSVVNRFVVTLKAVFLSQDVFAGLDSTKKELGDILNNLGSVFSGLGDGDKEGIRLG